MNKSDAGVCLAVLVTTEAVKKVSAAVQSDHAVVVLVVLVAAVLIVKVVEILSKSRSDSQQHDAAEKPTKVKRGASRRGAGKKRNRE